MLYDSTKPVLATKTIQAINSALEADQGNAYRRLLRETMPQAEDAYREDNDGGFRSHLGASLIGRDCSRELWYTFRWSTNVRHEGRMLRLFNRGHLEEPRFVALLRMIGYEVWQHDGNGKQFRVSVHDGHFGGSLDSVIRGCLDYDPVVAILCEFKTHNDKSFEKLQKEGVRQAKFEHFVQMQIYMQGHCLPAALYLAVNKNNDDLYGEIVPYEKEQADQYYDRGRLIILTEKPPPKLSESPGFWKCKFCSYNQICHFNIEPARNCRTCIHSYPTEDATWTCGFHKAKIPKSVQLEGCAQYRWIPH